jgi:hypothetical protein
LQVEIHNQIYKKVFDWLLVAPIKYSEQMDWLFFATSI